MNSGDEYESGSGDGYDGGRPGGVPERQSCTAPACPACELSRQVSTGCLYPLGHTGSHGCESSHTWDDYDVYKKRCFELCGTCSAWCVRDEGHDGVHWCGQHDY
jgi:hypothetical protein